ncbi:MAG: mechanosensitive ion channel [Methylococcaceae bacterium]|nr:mechanosensitive ion channel [Methylococcaceae bacterium]
MDVINLAGISLTNLDVFVFAINLLILLGSRHIIDGFNHSSNDSSSATKLWALRVINLILFSLYFIAFFDAQYTRQISLTGLTFLLAFILVQLLQLFLLRKFGRVKEIDDEKFHVETYQSEMFSLLAVLLAVLLSILIIINIWEMTDWLQATSVLGALLLLVYSTKDVWAADNINGLILLYNSDVEAGSVVKITELDLLAITLQTTLSQTTFRDLAGRHKILLPNAMLRGSKIEVLTQCPASGLRQFVDFNIGYGFESTKIEAFLTQVWENACEAESAINADKLVGIKLMENGDHAVRWRLVYSLKNVHKLIDAQCAVNRAAYDLSLIENIGLSTPLTHEVNLNQKP